MVSNGFKWFQMVLNGFNSRRYVMAATNILMAYPTTEKEDLDVLLEDPDVISDDDEDDDGGGGEEEEEEEEDGEWEDESSSSSSSDADATVSDGDDFDAKEAATDAEMTEGSSEGGEDENDDKNGRKPRRFMPKAVRVPGGLVQSAVALRLREKRLLKSAVRWLARREATLDELQYQAGHVHVHSSHVSRVFARWYRGRLKIDC